MKRPISFGKYLLLERINVGGMAEIFLARSRGVHGFKRLLAMKRILPTMAEDKEFIAMFIDEARIASELSHPGIVQIFELGRSEEDYYIAMEFVHGKDLRYIQERMARERTTLPVLTAAFLAYKISDALDYAHNRKDPSGRPLGIIHRDVSPQNVIISYDGEVKICDFGIAKATNRSQKTQAGVLKGKFGYMSPEQVRGLPLDGRSDIFTVGTLLYEMVTLERLFLGESDFSTLEKVRNADVVPPSTYNHAIPEALELIIMKALAKEVEDRYQSAAEFGDALQRFMLQTKMASSRDLSGFMKNVFRVEHETEILRIESFQNLPESELEAYNLGQTDKGKRRSLAPEAEQPASVDPNANTQIFESDPDGELDAGVDLNAQTHIFDSADAEKPAARLDMNAKTLIFGSGDEAAKTDSAPHAGSPSGDSPGSLMSAPTEIFAEGGASSPAGEGLGDARTMIFADVDVQPETNDDSSSRSERVAHRQGAGVGAAVRGRARTWPDRLFFPLLGLSALLLVWALLATLRTAPAESAKIGQAFELVTTPAIGVKVFLDGTEVTSVTPYVVNSISAGHYHLKVTRTGYQDFERDLRIDPGTRLVMEAVLVPMAVQSAPQPGNALQRASASPAKKPAADLAEAVLLVESVPPGAIVAVNDKKMGATPLNTGKLKAGDLVKVHLTLDGYLEARRELRMKAGRGNKLTVNLIKAARLPASVDPNRERTDEKTQYGFLVANTVPWSKVFLNGKYTGRETPIALDNKLRVPAGKHQVVFETPEGKQYAFEVTVKPGQVVKLIKRLEG